MNFSLYQEAFKSKFQNVYKLHNFLDDLNEENYHELIEFINNNNFLEDKKAMSQLLRSINSFSLCRPTKLVIYCQLINDILEKISAKFKPSELSSIFHHNRILLLLYEKGAISISNIFSRDYYIKDSIYLYFQEELKKDESLKYEKIYKSYYDSEMSTEESELFSKHKRQAFCSHELCSIIRNDDLDAFQSVLSRSESIILRQPIPQSLMIYEQHNYLLREKSITFLEYAAYYGSIKIFKFLWNSQDCYINPFNIDYAIAGGNVEIFHIYEDHSSNIFFALNMAEEEDDNEKEIMQIKRYKFVKIMLKASLFFHRNDIAEYVINNYSCYMNFEIDLKKDFEGSDLDENELAEKIKVEKLNLFYSFPNYHFILKNYNIRFLMDHIDDISIFEPYYQKYINFEDEYHLHLREISYKDDNFDFKSSKNSSLDNHKTPLCIACFYGHSDIADLLLNSLHVNGNVSEISDNLFSPFHLAIWRQKNEVVSLFLNINDPNFNLNQTNSDGITPFLESCRSSNFDIFVELFNNGFESKSNHKIDIFAVSDSKSTPLHYAAVSNSIDILDFLVSKQIYNVDAQDSEGWTPLMNGCDYDIVELVKILIEKGKANPNLVENFSSTALMKYSGCNCIDCVKYLVDLPNIKESLNAQDSDGNTVIHRVSHCRMGEENQSVLFLIREKNDLFDLNIRNNKGISFILFS